jgi:hypothetical protein
MEGFDRRRFPKGRLVLGYYAKLVHPLDDFIEAVTFGPNDSKVIDVVDAIVEAELGEKATLQ